MRAAALRTAVHLVPLLLCLVAAALGLHQAVQGKWMLTLADLAISVAGFCAYRSVRRAAREVWR